MKVCRKISVLQELPGKEKLFVLLGDVFGLLGKYFIIWK